MKRFIIPITIIGLSFSLLINGCSTKKEEGKTGQKKIVLRWSGYAGVDFDAFRISESKKFEELHPEVVVKYESIVGDFRSKILTQLAGGVAPDMFYADDLQAYIERDVLVDLTDWVEEDKSYFSEINPRLIEGQRWNGRIYALPGNCNIIGLLYYNKDLFDAENLPYPDESWTWEDLIESAKRLTQKDSGGRINQFGYVNSILGGDIFYIYQNGGSLWNKDKTKCIINSQESAEALNFSRELHCKYHVSPTLSESKFQTAINSFLAGRVAMLGGNSWDVCGLKKGKGTIGINWDATLMPRPKKDSPIYANYIYLSLGIWKGSKHPRLTYELAKFMSTPERVKFLIKMGDSVPFRQTGEAMDFYWEDPGNSEGIKKALLKAFDHAKDYYRTLINPEVPYLEQQEIIRAEMERFHLGFVSAEETLHKIQDKLNKKIRP